MLPASGATAALATAAQSLTSGVPRSGALAPPPAIASLIDAAPWRGGLEPSGDFTALATVSGKLPTTLRGTLYRVGPGRVRVGPHLYGHWFDGDGAVTAVRLPGDGTCSFSTALVQTERLRAQSAAWEGRIAVRGAWTQAHDWWKNLFHVPTNPANTAPLLWENRLFALCEGGPPVEVHPFSLHTLGDEPRYLGSKLALGFGAHFKVDEASACLYDTSVNLPNGLRVFRLDADGKEQASCVIPMDKTAMVHDFAMSENYLVFVIPPYTTGGGARLAALVGFTPFGHAFSWKEGRGTRVVVLRKSDFSVAVDTELFPAFSLYHLGNAWEEEDGTLKVQMCRLVGSRAALEANFSDMYSAQLQTPDSFNQLFQLEVAATALQPKDGGGVCTSAEALSFFPVLPEASPLPMEFPIISPLRCGRKHRFVYVAAKSDSEPSYFDALQKYDLQAQTVSTRVCAPGEYASEVIFVPTPGGKEEDEGHLLLLVYVAATHSTRLDVLDARDVAGAPVASCSLPPGKHIPYTFHGLWAPERV